MCRQLIKLSYAWPYLNLKYRPQTWLGIMAVNAGNVFWRQKHLSLIRRLMGKISNERAVIVAQFVEQFLLIPEVCSLNPVIGNIYIEHLFSVNCIEKTK